MNSFLIFFILHISYVRYQKCGKNNQNFRFAKLYPYQKIMNVITQTKIKGKLTITRKTPILAEVNTGLRHQEEVWNIMEQETSQSEKDVNYDQDLFRRREILASQFQALPTYGSVEFWSLIEEPQSKLALPLEVLVKCIRVA